MEKQKSDFWWMIKGICAIAVIAIHSFISMEVTGSVVVTRQFINFPVILFIFMAGYFVNVSKIKSDWKKWTVGRLRRIMLPYLVFSVLYLLFAWRIKGMLINWKGVIASILLGTSNVHMYYCIVMLQLIIITPLIIALYNKSWLKYVCFFVTAAGVAQRYIGAWKPPAFLIFDALCAPWLLFYVWGIYAGTAARERKEKTVSFKKDVLWLLAAAAFMFAESWFLFQTETFHILSVTQVRIGNFVFTACLIRLVLDASTKDIRPVWWLCSIGKISFGIYLIHMFIVDALLQIYPKANYFVILCTALAGSYVICVAGKQVKKLMPHKEFVQRNE